MSNNLRTRNALPYNFEDGILSKGKTVSFYVDNVAELRDLEVTGIRLNDVVELLGYYTPGDGGGGTLYWNATSTDADNGGTVFLPSGHATAGRWLRVVNGSVNVKWFGAKGDGVTDDTDVIQSCIYFIEAIAPYGTVPTQQNRCKIRPAVYVPAAAYLLNGTLRITQPGVKIYGDGKLNTIILKGILSDTVVLEMGTFNASGGVFTSGPQDCFISDLSIFNNRWGFPYTASLGTGIRLNGCGGLRLDKVSVFGFYVGVSSPYGGDYNQFNDVTVETCVIGIYQGPGGQQTELNKIQISNCSYGIVLDRPGHITINSPILNGCGENSILIEAISDTTTRYMTSIGGGGALFMHSQIVINEPWFESAPGGYQPVATHYVYCDNRATDAYRNITINNAFIVSGTFDGKTSTSFVANSGVGPGMQRVNINNPVLNGAMDYWAYNATASWALNSPSTASGYIIPKYSNSNDLQVKDIFQKNTKGYVSNRVFTYQNASGGVGITEAYSDDKVRYAFNNVTCNFLGKIENNILTVETVYSGALAIGNLLQTDGLDGNLTITGGSGLTWNVTSKNQIKSRVFYAINTIYRFGFDIQNRRLFLGDPDLNDFSISRGTVPTSGTYSSGSFVYNTAPVVVAGKSLMGWQRLTTGSAHVLGVDWTPCYVSNS